MVKTIKSKKEVWVSRLALDYLQSKEVEEAFCGDCLANSHYEGYFNPSSGYAEPPDEECPADFEIGSRKCVRKQLFEEVVDTLVELDQLVGLRPEVKLIL